MAQFERSELSKFSFSQICIYETASDRRTRKIIPPFLPY